MGTRLFVSLAMLLAASAVPDLALARASAAVPPCSGYVVTTPAYRLALVIGPKEEMYLPSEVSARHIKKGQVMLGGEMVMLDSAPAGMRIYNLEVHICKIGRASCRERV